MASREMAALELWRAFAGRPMVSHGGKVKTWRQYIEGNNGKGYADEERVVQPTVFPAFAEQCLSWRLQLDLAPEKSGAEGKPDFTPADSVTHPFVFETKSTNAEAKLTGFETQVKRYLTDGAPRIQTVLLTNLVGAKVFTLDAAGNLLLKYEVNLRGLLIGPVDDVAKQSEARKLADLFEEFKRQELTDDEKIVKVRSAPDWNPLVAVTDSEWIGQRIDKIVESLTRDVLGRIKRGALQDNSVTSADDRAMILAELRLLANRLGVAEAHEASINAFINAGDASLLGKAVQQFAAHVAYFTATRLMLIRVWEDLGLLDPILHDGGFDKQMENFVDVLEDVISFAFTKAKGRYRALFDQNNSYTWYQPDRSTYINVIYELANTYLGEIQSDILGQVYERMLERIDRKLLGVYYTPRDIISLIWDLIGFDAVATEVEQEDREPRILDIATGSGGFLVDAARRLRQRVVKQRREGANIDLQQWLNEVDLGLNGVEVNRFSAYLAELNLLVQLGHVIAEETGLRLPTMGVITGDTLSLHNPDEPPADWESAQLPPDLLAFSEDRRERARRIKAAAAADSLMDIACGNPPYVGEKTIAETLRRTRRDYPYWEQFVGQHMDYLYWFLILGVSKLRKGGRFGFITTEYWLRAAGAGPLREYLAARCEIDRIVLFRDFRLFPDAPGQHSMIITGTRVAGPDPDLSGPPPSSTAKPQVSIFRGSLPVKPAARVEILKAIREGKTTTQVRTFKARRSPNTLGGTSWADVILTQSQLRQREHLTAGEQVALNVTKGNETTANKVTESTEGLLTGVELAAVGGPGSDAGIQLLTHDEVAGLGPLNAAEKKVLRKVINTKDVYPYAVVLPEKPDQVIYLAKPSDLDADLTDEQIITGTPFPSGLSSIQQHLTQFRSLLAAKNRSHNERRPWWTLHRPRVNAADGAASKWANYCVLSRWGTGGTLCVGRAPAGTSPASGLHVLQAADKDGNVLPAQYLAALYNSALYQEIAESLPPGNLRKQDLQQIGLPLRSDYTRAIADAADALADLVTDIVQLHVPKFPLLGDSLRRNVALNDLTDDVWSAAAWPITQSGAITAVSWIETVAFHTRARSTEIGEARVVDDLLGRRVEILARGAERLTATILLKPEIAEDVAGALAAQVRALAVSGGKLGDVSELVAPTDPAKLTTRYAADRAALQSAAANYRGQRAIIDETLEMML